MGRGNDSSEAKINGLIDKGCSMEGKLAFDGSVQINGDFRGEIVSDGTLLVGPDARVEGRIQVGSAIVEGNLQGTVEAKTRIDLRRGSRMIADIRTPAIGIEDGAIFHGSCCMLDDQAYQANVHVQAQKEVCAADDAGDSLMM